MEIIAPYILPGLLLAVGLVIYALGHEVFNQSPFIGGFLLGGVLSVYIVTSYATPPAGLEAFYPYIVFIIGGLLGGLIARPLYMVIVVISGSAFGALLGIGFGFIVNLQGDPNSLKQIQFAIQPLNNISIWLMIIFALILAVLSLIFDDFMLVVSTAFLGSAVIMGSLAGLFSTTIPIFGNIVFQIFVWFGLGMGGLVYQNSNMEP